MSIRDEVARNARAALLDWYGGVHPADVLHMRVSQAPEDGCWRVEFAVETTDDRGRSIELGWWGYLVEREPSEEWRATREDEGDSLLDEADAWEPATFDPVAHGWED